MRPLLHHMFEPPAARSTSAAAPPRSPSLPALHRVETVVALRRLEAADGDVALLAGYHSAGDGAAMMLRWDASSTAPDDGGLTFAGRRTARRAGRWLQIHDGVGDFRRFGIFSAETPADAALDAMIADPAIHRIEAHTDLGFVRRHVLRRSTIHLDFGGHLVTCAGIEPNAPGDPFGAVLFFTGTRTAETVTHTLTAAMPELVDVFEVGSSAPFAVGQWWAVTVNDLSEADARELRLMVQVTQVVDGTRIRVGYKTGWPFDAGRTFTWTRIEPVHDVTISNMRFQGADLSGAPVDGQSPDARETSGSHPVAFELAVRCDVADVHGTQTWWPVVMRRWCTHFRTERCSLRNPSTVLHDGAGHLTREISCLYGRVTDCTTSHARRLHDLAASAYCIVKNCHGDGAGGSPFTTRGQYEHDLVFEGNSGHMDVAGSAGQRSGSAKRITVRRHVCSWFDAGTAITDLTLEDVTLARSPSHSEARLAVNADGVQMRGCTAGLLVIDQRSSRSTRPNVIEGCSFSLPAGAALVRTPVVAPVHFVRCSISGFDGATLDGPGPVRFAGCALTGSPAGSPVMVASADLALLGSTLQDAALQLTAVRDQRVVVGGGTTVRGTTGGAAFFSRSFSAGNAGVVSWELGTADLVAATATTTHVSVTAGTNHVRAVGTRFAGGRLALPASGFGAGSSLLLSRCLEVGVARDVASEGPATTQNHSLQIA